VARPGRRKRADNVHAEGASHLAGRLRQLRERARKTQEEVAAAAGLSVATVRKIETGVVTEPGYFTILAIASAIGASITDLAELIPPCQLPADRPITAMAQRYVLTRSYPAGPWQAHLRSTQCSRSRWPSRRCTPFRPKRCAPSDTRPVIPTQPTHPDSSGITRAIRGID
jgi:transcriptional regulator with XRE-family HTH domain